MTLPASGPISMRDVNVELRANPESPLNMNHPDLRKIAGPSFVGSGSPISIADLRGKSYFDYVLYRGSLMNQYISPDHPSNPSRQPGALVQDGYRVECTVSSITLTKIRLYSDQTTLIGEYALNVAKDRLVSTSTTQFVFDPAPPASNNIYIRIGTYEYNRRVNIYRMEVVDSTGTVYDLFRHRGGMQLGGNAGFRTLNHVTPELLQVVPPNA